MEWICLLIGLFVGFLLGALSAVGKERYDDSVGMFFHNALLQTGRDEEVHYIISRTSYDDGNGDAEPEPNPVLQEWRNN